MAVDLSKHMDTADPSNDQQYQQLLENLQCNILKSHGREQAAHIFLEFRGDADDAKNWIQDFSERFVTSARKQLLETKERRKQAPQERTAGELIGSFFLSAQGYEALGFSTEEGFEESFRKSMKDRGKYKLSFFLGGRRENKDPSPQEWEPPYRGDIHAMILLAHDDENVLRSTVNDIRTDVAPIARVLTVEYGKVLRNNNIQPNGKGQGIEHFGYVDGRSQPLFLTQDIEEERQRGGIDAWDPSAPLSLVLAKDPFAGESHESYGSYLVFRKLEQNVGGFKAREKELATALGLTGEDAERAGASVVGRFRDGTPLTLQPTDGLDMSGDRGNIRNNFTYGKRPDEQEGDPTGVQPPETKGDDPWGYKCPYHAHIRKVNPRGGAPIISDEVERERRIVRRGIPYGERAADLSDNPTGGVGLLFLCYQRDIHEQFEFIQRVWTDDRNFPKVAIFQKQVGDDALLGQDPKATQRQWPTVYGEAGHTIDFNFGGFITLNGGEYFFAPSLSFLKNIVHF